MTSIDSHGAEIAKQLKRIADALTGTDPNAGFADLSTDVTKIRLTEPRGTDQTGNVTITGYYDGKGKPPNAEEREELRRKLEDINKRWDRGEYLMNTREVMRRGQPWDHQGEGDHLLHDDGKGGEDVD